MYENHPDYEIGFDISLLLVRNFLFKRFEKGERVIWNPYSKQLYIFSHNLSLDEMSDLMEHLDNGYYYLLLESPEVVKGIVFNHLTNMFDYNFSLYELFTNQNSLDAKIILNSVYDFLMQNSDEFKQYQITEDYLLAFDFLEPEGVYIPWEVIKNITSFPVKRCH